MGSVKSRWKKRMVSRTKAASRIDHSRVATPSARQAPAISSKRPVGIARPPGRRSEEHTSELQSLMRISYAVFCLKKKNTNKKRHKYTTKTDKTESETIR